MSAAASRRGACPSLAAPMATGDGLLARLRPIGSALSLAGLETLARAARLHGNGVVEITARGSLQLRGLTETSAPALAEALASALDIETGVPVETPPLAGLDPEAIGDPRPLAELLRARIAEAGLAARLAPKVTAIVDGGERLGLDGLPADLRVRAEPGGWRVEMGATTRAGLDDGAALEAAMTQLAALADCGPGARGRDFGSAPPLAPSAKPFGAFTLNDGALALGFGVPPGGTTAEALLALAKAAYAAGAREFRFSPGRALLAVGLDMGGVAALSAAAPALGLIADPADPRLALAACPGAGACASGRLDTQRLAEEIAARAPALFDGSFTLHLSGCAKGCAHPRAALLTLAGTEAGPALVVGGRAGEAPVAVLDPGRIVAGFEALAHLYRARRHAQEGAADWLVRLGAAAIAEGFIQGWR